MSYNIKDKGEAVREIKKYLYLISENLYSSIPRTTIDSFYDIETREAVSEFQRIKELEVTGQVDYETFTLLFEDYSALVLDIEREDYVLTKEDFPFEMGDFSEDVKIINLIICELAKTYTEIPFVVADRFYSKETESAVAYLRALFLMDGEAIVDKELYNRMRAEVNARRLADKK